MGFSGWPASSVTFYEGLETDNSKAYWTDHKSTYDSDILAPMKELLEELAPEFGEARIFRPNRDIRFSADKSPYKTAIGATLRNGGYVQLSARGLAVGAGCHTMATDQLERYRVAVADDRNGEDLRRVLAEVTSSGLETPVYEGLKSAPRGYPKDHPREDLLRRKTLSAWKQWPVARWLHTAEAEERVIEALRASRPLVDWLHAHVGESALMRR